MTLPTFQAAVVRLYTDAAFRQSVRLDTAQHALTGLTTTERSAVESLSRMPELDEFAWDLQRKAFDFAWAHFATISRHFEPLRRSAFGFFVRHHDFKDRDWFDHIAHVGSMLEKWSAECPGLLPSSFADVVRYDLETLRADTRPVPDDELGTLDGRPPKPRPPAAWAEVRRFRVDPAVRIVPFDHDVAALAAGVSPTDLERRRCRLAFIPGHAERPSKAVALAPGILQILELAGTAPRSIDEMVEAMAALNGTGAGDAPFAAACVAALQALHEMGVLARCPSSSSRAGAAVGRHGPTGARPPLRA